jgi:hypothetical protein
VSGGPYAGGWNRLAEGRKAHVQPEDRAAGSGRRLDPAELAKTAAEMGLAVSPNRYRPETALDRAKRAAAYQAAAKAEAKLKPLDPYGEEGTKVPKYIWKKRRRVAKPRRRK